MHFQPGMAKLILCARGAVDDVLVDLRRGSPTFGRLEGFEFNDSKHHQVHCPDGLVHGFCVLSDIADVVYMTSAYDDPSATTRRYSLSSDKLKGLGWRAQVHFAKGLERTVGWYRENECWWQPIRSGAYREYRERHQERALKVQLAPFGPGRTS
jgi:hypothetical protein